MLPFGQRLLPVVPFLVNLLCVLRFMLLLVPQILRCLDLDALAHSLDRLRADFIEIQILSSSLLIALIGVALHALSLAFLG